jgi:hypothetical protein
MLIFLFLLLFLACSPERDNVYDPKAKNYKKTGSLCGFVFDHNGTGLKGVEITLQGEEKKNTLITKSEDNGFFKFFDIPLDSYLIKVYKENYREVNFYKRINNYQVETLKITLFPLPYLKNCQIVSYYEERYLLPESLSLLVNCEIEDRNLKESYLLLPTLDTFYLARIKNQSYERVISAEELRGNFDDLVGKSFKVYLISNFLDTLIFETPPLIRIIRELPEPLYPINGEATSYQPTLIFSSPKFRFTHNFFIKVYYLLNNRFPILCYSDTLISQNDTVVSIRDSLIAGLYLWRVGVKDAYGNKGLSKEALFEVISKK